LAHHLRPPTTLPIYLNASGSSDQKLTVGCEAQLWRVSNALRSSMDAAEYTHVVLGLTFPKYASDAFEPRPARLLRGLMPSQRAPTTPGRQRLLGLPEGPVGVPADPRLAGREGFR
jgi:hypothetical protein